MVEIVSKTTVMRIEKQVLVMKRQVLGKCCEFAEKYLEFRDVIKAIAHEAGRPPDEVWEWALSQIDEDVSEYYIEPNGDEDD